MGFLSIWLFGDMTNLSGMLLFFDFRAMRLGPPIYLSPAESVPSYVHPLVTTPSTSYPSSCSTLSTTLYLTGVLVSI